MQESRLYKIINYLQKNNARTFLELADHTGVSVCTIRNDISVLQKRGLASAVRGGAILNNIDFLKQPFNVRAINQQNEKSILPHLLEKFIKNNMTIAISGGSTNIEVAKFLAKKYSNLNIITTNLGIIPFLKGATDFTVTIPGGLYDKKESTVYGQESENIISSYPIDLAVISVTALSAEKGVTDYRINEASMLRTMIDTAKETIIVADSSKFDKVNFINICEFDRISFVITNEILPTTKVMSYNKLGVKIITGDS